MPEFYEQFFLNPHRLYPLNGLLRLKNGMEVICWAYTIMMNLQEANWTQLKS